MPLAREIIRSANIRQPPSAAYTSVAMPAAVAASTADIAIAVFPIAGRAAMMMRSPFG
jgi:hypothetical protein